MKIKTISKKEIREKLPLTQEECSLGWDIWKAGAFIYDDKLELFVAYHGQGLSEIVSNQRYSEMIEFKDVLLDKYNYPTIKDKVDAIHSRIEDMVADYNLEHS